MLLLIWNFVLDIKQANGNNARVILVGLVNLISLFKQARRSQLIVLPTPRPHPGSTMQERLRAQQIQPGPKWMAKERPSQKKNQNHSLEMLFPTFASLFLCFGCLGLVFFHIISWHFISAAYYIRISYYFFILFHFKTIKTICHLVNTNIFSFLDQSVSCLCCNGSLTLFFFTRQAGDTLIRCQTVSLQQTGNTLS